MSCPLNLRKQLVGAACSIPIRYRAKKRPKRLIISIELNHLGVHGLDPNGLRGERVQGALEFIDRDLAPSDLELESKSGSAHSWHSSIWLRRSCANSLLKVVVVSSTTDADNRKGQLRGALYSPPVLFFAYRI